MKGKNKPIVLVVLDGWGHREEKEDNAIVNANTPFFDKLWSEYPHSLLKASGEAVGLPAGQAGNSEVGHMTIGAGKPIETDLLCINKSIQSGEFKKKKVFLSLFEHVKEYNSTLHILGLLSPGGVHSHQEHLFTLLSLAKENRIQRIVIHAFTDGRDTAPKAGSQYLKKLEDTIEKLNKEEENKFTIGSVSGRYYAMDRDNNWDRLALAEKAIFEGEGNSFQGKPSEYVEEEYKKGESDEFLRPAVFPSQGGENTIQKNDAIFFFNFRPDRARMLSKKIQERTKGMNTLFGSMTKYSDEIKSMVAFSTPSPKTTLGKEISKAGMKQARIAETEKFAHATYFLNCGEEKPYPGEKDILLKSRDDIETHDQAPEMRAEAITQKAIQEIQKGESDFIFINFANADMVGHTANVPAIIKAVETVDQELKKVVEEVKKKGGIVLITADHGNAEINVDTKNRSRHTSHTSSPVPLIITKKGLKLKNGELSDIAPTILSFLDISIPKEMSGKLLY